MAMIDRLHQSDVPDPQPTVLTVNRAVFPSQQLVGRHRSPDPLFNTKAP